MVNRPVPGDVESGANVVSGVPSGFNRAMAKSVCPAAEVAEPTTTILPSDCWTATALPWSAPPKSMVVWPVVLNMVSIAPAGVSRSSSNSGVERRAFGWVTGPPCRGAPRPGEGVEKRVSPHARRERGRPRPLRSRTIELR